MRVVLSLSFFILLMSLGIYSKAQLAGAYNVYYFRVNMDPSYYTDGNYAGIPYDGPARITLFSGEVIEDGQFKLNLYNGRIFTEDNQKQLIVLTSAVKRLEFLNDGKRAAVFQAGFPKIDKQRWDSFYQILAEGKTKLLKFIRYTYSDRMQYGQGVTFKVEPLFYKKHLEFKTMLNYLPM